MAPTIPTRRPLITPNRVALAVVVVALLGSVVLGLRLGAVDAALARSACGLLAVFAP